MADQSERQRHQFQQMLEAMIHDRKLNETRAHVATARTQLKYQTSYGFSRDEIAKRYNVSKESFAPDASNMPQRMVNDKDRQALIDGRKKPTEEMLVQIANDYDLRDKKRSDFIEAGTEFIEQFEQYKAQRIPKPASVIAATKPMTHAKAVLQELVKSRAFEKASQSIRLQQPGEKLTAFSSSGVLPLSLSCLQSKFCPHIVGRIADAKQSTNGEIYETEVKELVQALQCTPEEEQRLRDAINADGVAVNNEKPDSGKNKIGPRGARESRASRA